MPVEPVLPVEPLCEAEPELPVVVSPLVETNFPSAPLGCFEESQLELFPELEEDEELPVFALPLFVELVTFEEPLFCVEA